jgi:serine/threonine protein kinase
MSPEQIQGREADGRSDIFAFGAVRCEMFTGKRAIEGKSQLSVASAILEKEPPPMSSLQPMTPAAPDGQRFLVNEVEDSEGVPLVVYTGWLEGLKKSGK